MSLSQNRMRLRALVCFTYVPCRSPEELFASSPCQNPKGLGLPLVHRKGYFQRTAPGKLFFLTFVWGRGIASLLLVSLKKVINCNDLPLLRPTMHLTRPLKVLRYMTHSLLYTRLSPLFNEMSLAADSNERKLVCRRLLGTRLFYYLHG